MQFKAPPYTPPVPPKKAEHTAAPAKQENFFRTMSAQEYRAIETVLKSAPEPNMDAAVKTAQAVSQVPVVRENIILPTASPAPQSVQIEPAPHIEPEQTALPMPEEIPWRLVGQLYNSYILVEQGEEAFLIDKHAAHERILFEKLKANQETISSQALLAPQTLHLSADSAAILLENSSLLQELGFEIEEFGAGTILLRQVPMDLDPQVAGETLEAMAADLQNGRREKATCVRDEILHTVACKAAIKAGWHTDSRELKVLVDTVMSRQELKYCPHGRPICISLSKKQLEKQFKR